MQRAGFLRFKTSCDTMLSFERYFIGQQIGVRGQKSSSNRCIIFPGAPWAQVGKMVRKTAKSVGIELLLL